MGRRPGFLLATMSKNLEEANVGFLRQVMGNTSKRQMDGTCINAAAARVLKEAVTKTLGTYL